MKSAALRLFVPSLLTAITLAAAGCGHQSTVYHPAGAVTRKEETRPPTKSYSIVGQTGKGALHVFSLGGKRLPVGPGGAPLYLHLRVAAQNVADATAWALDPNEQLLGYDGTMVAPAFSETSLGRPVLSLPQGGSGYLDLYYPLPKDGDPDKLTLAWRLRRGNTSATVTTEFVKVSGREVSYYGLGYGDSDTGSYYYHHHYSGAHVGLGWWWPESCLWWHGPSWYGYSHPRSYVRQSWTAPPLGRERSGGGSTWSPPSSPRDSSSTGYSGNWRAPSPASSSPSSDPSGGGAAGAPSPSPSPDAAGKSAWRGGGR
jgi:hypothetical protein